MTRGLGVHEEEGHESEDQERRAGRDIPRPEEAKLADDARDRRQGEGASLEGGEEQGHAELQDGHVP